jgi:proteasome lid subunit RPN8/RPN11
MMVAHVDAHAPEEACGLVGGAGGRAVQVVPVENVLHSAFAYRMEAEALVRAILGFEAGGLDLLAIFHSHPGGPAGPSQTDVREAYYPESLYLIFSPAEAGGWQGRAFQIDEGRVTEAQITLEEEQQGGA